MIDLRCGDIKIELDETYFNIAKERIEKAENE